MENCSTLDQNTYFGEADFESDFELENRPGTPVELIAAAKGASEKLIPSKSSARYQQEYENFVQWKNQKKTTSNSERVLLAYFCELAGKFKSSSLWSKYSMLKSTLSIKANVDISTYASLTAYLKAVSKDYEPKQAKVFTEHEIQHFLNTAPDDLWLDVKVVCAFGVMGACRTHELPEIRMEHITTYDDMYYVQLPKALTKTSKKNHFAITGQLFSIVQKYERLRPSHVKTDRFFLNFQKGKCTIQTIGKGKFYKMPLRIATYLNLPEPHLYTGHSLRRSSATIYANTGASIEDIKRHTGHKSTIVAEMYIGDSIAHKTKAGNAISSSLNRVSSSTSVANSNHTRAMKDLSYNVIGMCGVASSSAPYINKEIVYKPVNAIGSSSLNCTITSTSAGASSVPIDIAMNDHNAHSINDDVNNIRIRGEAPSSSATASNNSFESTSVPVEDTLMNMQMVGDNAGSETCDSIEENDVQASQVSVSHQNFLSRLEKQFSFYKCDGLTINFK